MLSKKHYEAIAKAMSDTGGELWEKGFKSPATVLDPLVDKFVVIFRQDNPNFNAKKFADAVFQYQKTFNLGDWWNDPEGTEK